MTRVASQPTYLLEVLRFTFQVIHDIQFITASNLRSFLRFLWYAVQEQSVI